MQLCSRGRASKFFVCVFVIPPSYNFSLLCSLQLSLPDNCSGVLLIFFIIIVLFRYKWSNSEVQIQMYIHTTENYS